MKPRIAPALAAALFAAATLPAAAGLPLEQALQGAPGCQHVIDLLNRYGASLPLTDGVPMASPMGPLSLSAADIGDLAIAAVVEVPSDPSGPPSVSVAVTNNSSRGVTDVRVSVVALLAAIDPWSPTATAAVAEIPPGATVEVLVTLPAEALAMGSNGGAPVGFQKLLVAVDAFDAFAESDESNNLKLVARGELGPAPVIAEPVGPSQPPAAATVPYGAQPEPVAPSADPAARAAIDSALEQFGLDTQGEEAALRL